MEGGAWGGKRVVCRGHNIDMRGWEGGGRVVEEDWVNGQG